MATQNQETFAKLFGSAQHSALHLEMRDVYLPNDPDFIEWQKGHRPDSADRDSWWEPWYQLVQDTVDRGVEVRRARIVSEPITDSVRHEYDWTFANIAAGEVVRWLPRRNATDLALPGNDFWLFDNRIVLVLHFTGDGDITNLEVRDDPELAKLCSSAFEAVWERATPHEDYVPA